MVDTTVKKRYFKKEKKQLKLKRHKAKSATQLQAAERKGLRRGVQGDKENKQKSPIHLGKKIIFPKIQFPNISRFITESFDKLRIGSFETFTLGSFFKLSTIYTFSKKQVRRAKRKNFWMSVLLLVVLVFAGLLGWKLWQEYTTWKNAKEEYVKLQYQLVTWENITRQYPTYRDAYFEAAVLAYRLGEKDKEMEYVQKTLSIDPNFQPAIQLKQISNGNK